MLQALCLSLMSQGRGERHQSARPEWKTKNVGRAQQQAKSHEPGIWPNALLLRQFELYLAIGFKRADIVDEFCSNSTTDVHMS